MAMMIRGSSNPIAISVSISSAMPSSSFPVSPRRQFSPPSVPAFGTRTGIGIGLGNQTNVPSDSFALSAATGQMTTSGRVVGGLIGRNIQKWWEKGLQPNMIEIASAQHLVDSLLNAGDTLVILDFFSPGCGGCKSLHPKICQFAEMNPDVKFLQVNYEEHKSMCYSLGVHVLPFFRFYRGAQGRVCSFSCTNATIKKFKDALAKYNIERCSLGPAKGLEEKELLALASNKDLNFTYVPQETHIQELEEEALLSPLPSPTPLSPIRVNASSLHTQDDKTLASLTSS